MGKADFKVAGPDDPVAVLANALAGEVDQIGARYSLSKMNVCVAMANAVGYIMADAAKDPGKALPREAAKSRMRDLHRVMRAAYELRGTEGSA
jgi:hypothetical protein